MNIDNDADEKYIEFLSQNEGEEFAHDYHKLTNAVYTRILKRDEKGLITTKEVLLNAKLETFKLHIIYIQRIESLKLELEQKSKELGTNKKLVDSFSSEEYKKLNDELKVITTKLNRLNASSEQYSLLIKELTEITNKSQQNNPQNQYSQEINRIVKAIEVLSTECSLIDFAGVKTENAALV